MRIELRRSGGFAGNIRRPPLEVDTAALPEKDARELEALAEAALAQPPPAGGAGYDRSQLELTIEHEGELRTLAVDEAAAPEEMRALAGRVQELGSG